MKRILSRIFTEKFKKEVVRLFKQQDLTSAKVNRNLALRQSHLIRG